MRKFIALLISAAFVFGMAGVAAAADVELGGHLKMWNYYRSAAGLPSDTADSEAFSQTRARIGASIKADKVSGMLEFATDSDGAPGGSDFITWGTGNSTFSGMVVRQAWVSYKDELGGTPAGFKIGHMGLKLGHGKFFNWTRHGTDAIVFFMDPNDQTHVGLLTFKANEGAKDQDTDDKDAYVGLVTYKVNDNTTVGANYTTIRQGSTELAFSNLGLHANGSVAGVSYKAEVDIQFGDLAKDYSTGGLGIYVAGAYKLDPANLRLAIAMGSGDDTATTDKNEGFVTFLGPDKNVAWIYEYQITSANRGTPATISGTGSKSGIGNTTYVNLGVDYPATDALKVSVDGWYFMASDPGFKAGTTTDASNAVGTELDVKTVYKLTDSLSWTVMAGYFAPGAFYEDVYNITTEGVMSARSDITLKF